MGAGVGLDDVPHLRLAHLAMYPLCHLVVRVDLDAQVALGIDEFDEQGQLAVVFRIDLLAKDGLGSFVDDRDEVPTLPLTIADDAGAGGYSTDLPALAYGLAGRGESEAFKCFAYPMVYAKTTKMAMMTARAATDILSIFSKSFRRSMAAKLFCLKRLAPSFL